MEYINLNVNSGERMLDYYPEVIKTIKEFKAITDIEGTEIDQIRSSMGDVLNNAYLLTMSLDRVVLWEKVLGIKPLENSTISDRRDTIIARIRGQGKLNTALINSIVNAFTGGTANSWIENGVLYVEITPPPGNKQYQFANVEQEISNKVPAHLGLRISRSYYTWSEIKSNSGTWQNVKNNFDNWEDVYLFVPFTKSKGGM